MGRKNKPLPNIPSYFKERGFRENGFIFNSDNSIEILDSYNPLIFFYLIKKSELKPIFIKIIIGVLIRIITALILYIIYKYYNGIIFNDSNLIKIKFRLNL